MKRVAIMRSARFLELASALGIGHGAVQWVAALAGRPSGEPAPSRTRTWGGPLNGRDYWVDAHGSVRRRAPKRDKSLSARQCKKRAKILRRIAKA